MAYTTPATAVAGTVLTAAWLNTYVRDNMSAVKALVDALGGYTMTIANVVNTAVETTTCSFTVLASTMADGDVIEILLAIVGKQNTGGGPTVTQKMYWGATVVTIANAIVWAGNASERNWLVRYRLQRVGADVWVRANSGGSVEDDQVPFTDFAGTQTNVGILVAPTLNSDQTVALKITLSGASAEFYWKTLAARAFRHP